MLLPIRSVVSSRARATEVVPRPLPFPCLSYLISQLKLKGVIAAIAFGSTEQLMHSGHICLTCHIAEQWRERARDLVNSVESSFVTWRLTWHE